ncbi:MAG: SIR2 family protein, partial [Chlamydiales bacterium]
LEGGHQAKIDLGETPDDAEIAPYRTIRQEAEWFVQHCCEQIKSDAAIRMWSPTLRASTNIELTIASTNYDRAIEITAARLSLSLDDGFDDFAGKEFAQWRGFQNNGGITLLKLHGSTDWYRAENDNILKLRHPMPLFGKLKILPEEYLQHPLHSALVLPSREKVITLTPFPAIAAEFRQKAKATDIAIFLGSSLRDPHMRDVCVTCASTKPTFIISRSGNFEEGMVPKDTVILRQSSGRFLTSTFPKFLLDRDESVLVSASRTPSSDSSNVLDYLVSACDENLDPIVRCHAIENLADAHVSLHQEEIKQLMKSSIDEVATYALGLIPTSFNRDALLEIAKRLAQERPDSQFYAELEILLQLLDRTRTK